VNDFLPKAAENRSNTKVNHRHIQIATFLASLLAFT